MWASMAGMGGSHGPDQVLDELSARLAASVEGVVGAWVERSVRRRLGEWTAAPDPGWMRAASEAGDRAAREVGADLRRLLALDVDQQWTSPLAVLRRAVRFPTEVLAEAGVPPVVRDAYDEERFPDDPYDLAPRALADLDPTLQELGLAWGAAKAQAHLARHRAPSGRQHDANAVVAYTPDLMDRSRINAAAPGTAFVSRLEELGEAAARAEVVVVDLERPGVLDLLPELVATGARVVGFGSHVDRTRLDDAAAAGATAMPRSQFFRSLGDLAPS